MTILRAPAALARPTRWVAGGATIAAGEFILRRHDRCGGRPSVPAVAADRLCTALTWNVFQTLRLIAPAFWMRRLRARLVGVESIDHVPLAASIDLWESDAAADAGAIRADVIVETEHAVIGLLTLFRKDLAADAATGTALEQVLDLIDAVASRAGVRDSYVGVITSDAADSPMAMSLVDRRAAPPGADAAALRARTVGRSALCGIGWATWGDMLAILDDCAAAAVLDDLERYAARRAARWLRSAGISPAR